MSIEDKFSTNHKHKLAIYLHSKGIKITNINIRDDWFKELLYTGEIIECKNAAKNKDNTIIDKLFINDNFQIINYLINVRKYIKIKKDLYLSIEHKCHPITYEIDFNLFNTHSNKFSKSYYDRYFKESHKIIAIILEYYFNIKMIELDEVKNENDYIKLHFYFEDAEMSISDINKLIKIIKNDNPIDYILNICDLDLIKLLLDIKLNLIVIYVLLKLKKNTKIVR